MARLGQKVHLTDLNVIAEITGMVAGKPVMAAYIDPITGVQKVVSLIDTAYTIVTIVDELIIPAIKRIIATVKSWFSRG
jgi:hypothetical protein